MDKSSGVGVLDKAVALLDAITSAPCSLNDLVAATGLTRPTAHRLALALEHHDLVGRDSTGRFIPGSHLQQWSTPTDPLQQTAEEIVIELRDATGVSAQVYRRVGDQRVCIAAAEPATGLRDTVPVGALLTLQAGSAAQVLVAWLPTTERRRFSSTAEYTERDLETVRRRGWAHSLGQREPGVGSISVPAWDTAGRLLAAVSLSGPQDRLSRPTPAQRALLLACAERLAG